MNGELLKAVEFALQNWELGLLAGGIAWGWTQLIGALDEEASAKRSAKLQNARMSIGLHNKFVKSSFTIRALTDDIPGDPTLGSSDKILATPDSD